MRKHKCLWTVTWIIVAIAVLCLAIAIIFAIEELKNEIMRDVFLGLGTGFFTSAIVSAFFAFADCCDIEKAKGVFNANVDYIVGMTMWFVKQTNQVYNNVNQYVVHGGVIVNNYYANIKIENDISVKSQTILNMLTDRGSPTENGYENNVGHNEEEMIKIEAVQSKIIECFMRVSERAFNRAERALEKCSDFIAKANNARIQFLEQYRRTKDLGQDILHPEAQSSDLMRAARSFLASFEKAELERELPYGDAMAYAKKWGEHFPASVPWIAEQDFISFPLPSARTSSER